MVEVHFINVGCGNMVLMHLSAGTTMLYDCNVTDENAGDVLTYLGRAMGDKSHIDIFVCSHRDSDHMRGIKRVHRLYDIRKLWDSGVPGTTPDSPEYHQYMDLRRSLPVVVEAEARKKSTFGDSVVRCMNSKDSDYTDANEQSIVLKIEYKGSSLLLAGDTNYRPWKEKILPWYGDAVASSILLAAHHGSVSFFDDPSHPGYVDHIKKISPAMTIVSVGPNVHGLPHQQALERYSRYSQGSDKGNKVYRTDKQGNMKVALKGAGAWSIWVHQ